MLAGRMIYTGNNLRQVDLPPEGSVIWLSPGEKGNKKPVIIPDNSGIKPDILTGDSEGSSCYILPLSAVEEFDYNFPDSSFAIFKLIDDNEV